MPPLPDLEIDADVLEVVRAFYFGIDEDPVLGRFFAGLDGDVHLPRMVSFWSSVVFQTGAYRGQPFAPHSRMPGLGREHFARWLERSRATVGPRYAGPRAARMVARAEQIAGVFQVKLGLWSVGTDEHR